MIDANSYINVLDTAQGIARDSNTLAMANSKLREAYNLIKAEIDTLSNEVSVDAKELEVMIKASAILASVSEENTNQILTAITDVINKSLGVLFPKDPKTVEITHSLYRDTHPHYTLTLKTQTGIARTFNQSGTGLAQVISFLFTACLIDARRGRKIMVMDELLNGLHPDAKALVASLMLALSTRPHDPFQFICVEYGMDIGRQYEIRKGDLPNALSVAEPWENKSSIGYYAYCASREKEGG